MEVLRLAGIQQRRESLGRQGDLLVVLENEPLLEILAQRWLGHASLRWLKI